MEKNFLQQFLETGLFDVGDSDSRLANLESSISDIEKNLAANIKLIPVYTLVALDPSINEDDQVLIDTETVVTTHWRALRTKYADRPVPLLRGVILNALYNLGTSNTKHATIISVTASNFYPFAQLNREATIVQKLLTELTDLAERHAIETWALATEEPNIKLPTLKIAGLKFGEVKINREALDAGMLAAAQTDPNTGHGPQHGSQHWSPHFGRTSAETIFNTLTEAFKAFGTTLSPETLETPINKFFTDFKKSLDATLKSSFNSINAVEQRSKLLWWKETLYSASLKKGYRDIDNVSQPLMMAYDLFMLLPNYAPISVDYLLKDTLRLVAGPIDEQSEFSKILTTITQTPSKELLKPYFGDKPELTGRVTVTDFLRLLINDRVKVTDFTLRTGINSKQKVGLSYFAIATLHDRMVEHLIK